MSAHTRKNMFQSGSFSCMSFPVAPSVLPGMDKKVAELCRIFFMDLNKIKPYVKHIESLSDEQINLSQGIFSHVLSVLEDDLKGSNMYVGLKFNKLTKNMIENIIKNTEQIINPLTNGRYSLKQVENYIKVTSAFLSLYHLVKKAKDAQCLKKSEYRIFEKMYTQYQKEYNSIREDKVVSALCDKSPMKSWFDIEEAEKAKLEKENKKPYIDFNTWELHKVSNMLGYHHHFANYGVEYNDDKTKVEVIDPLNNKSADFVRKMVSSFINNYCSAMESDNALAEIKRQVAIASFSAFNESLVRCSKSDYVSGYVNRAAKKRTLYIDKKTPEQEKQDAEEIQHSIIERSKNAIAGIGEIKTLLSNIFNNEMLSLTFSKEGEEKYKGILNRNSDHVMCCVKLDNHHIQAGIVDKSEFDNITDLDSLKNKSQKLCSFYNIESLIGELQSEMALEYFFPDLKEKPLICLA